MAAAARSQTRPRPARVRWDRISRVAMLFVLVVLLFLAISPVRSLITDLHVVSQRRAQLHALERVHAGLVAQEHALGQTATNDAEARNLGLVRPGEQEYVVNGL